MKRRPSVANLSSAGVRIFRWPYAEPNPLFYEQAAWGVTTRRDRLQALTALSSHHLPFAQKPELPPVFVASVRSLMTRTMPRRDFLKACKKLSVNQTIQPDALLRIWAGIGYQRVNTVLEPGQSPAEEAFSIFGQPLKPNPCGWISLIE